MQQAELARSECAQKGCQVVTPRDSRMCVPWHDGLTCKMIYSVLDIPVRTPFSFALNNSDYKVY